MAKGDNPNSRANLKPPSSIEARERGAKGGKRSGEVRQAQASFTASLKEKCTPEVLDSITDMLIQLASAGNLKAVEMLRDQLGEKPVEKLNVSTVDEGSVEKLQDAIKQRQNNEKA